jgi:hypothetical protein
MKLTYAEFRQKYDELTPLQMEWLKDKCNWEHMTPWAVMNDWNVPSDEDLRSGKFGDYGGDTNERVSS